MTLPTGLRLRSTFLAFLMLSQALGASTTNENWKFKNRVDPITDLVSDSATLSNGSDSLRLTCWHNDASIRPAVTLITPKNTNLGHAFDFNYVFKEYSIFRADIRFDKGVVYNAYFMKASGNLQLVALLSEDERVAAGFSLLPAFRYKLLSAKPNIGRFISAMATSESLVLRMTSASGSVDWNFKLSGSRSAIESLSQACNVKISDAE